MSHTKEPWVLSGRSIKQDYSAIGLGPESGQTIAAVMGGNTSGPYFVESDSECDANARRIVACVNACAGVDTVLLEFDQPRFVATLKQRAEFEQQRDELLDVVRRLISCDIAENINIEGSPGALKAARDALAKVGAGETAEVAA